MALGYLISPVIQIENIDGKPLVGGHVAVYRHGTSIPYITYKDFNGDLNPASVPLNMLGSCILIADDANSYDIYVTNRFGGEVLSRLGVTVNGGGGGGGITTITCSDGSINISQDGNVCDITMANDKPTVWVSDDSPAVYEQYLNEDGNFVLAEGAKVGTGLELVSGTLTVREDGWYHVSVNWNVEKGGGYRGETREIKLLVNGEVAGETLDMSMARDLRYGAWNGDLELEAGDTIVFSTDGLEDDHKTAARLNKVSVHKLASVIGGNTYTAGNGISLSPQNVISVDTSVVATQQDLGEINEVPASTSGDSGKVLTVDSQGVPVWGNIVVPTPTVPAPAYLLLLGTSGASSISLSADEAAVISDKSIFTLSGFIGLGDDFSPQTTATMLTLVLSLSDQNGNTVLASGPLMVEPNSRNGLFSGFITGYGTAHGGVVSVAATSVQDGPEGATYSVFKLRNIHLIGY